MKVRNLQDCLFTRTANKGGVLRAVNRFRKDEDGSLIIFGMIIFLLMLMIGGMAVDLMRHERMRTELQQTLDRSVLAAASLTQDLDAEAVVRDYFAKADLTEYLKSVTVVQGANDIYKRVSAVAVAETNPQYMHMMGIDELPAAATSGATQEVPDIEIVLVLDVSGSMRESAGTGTKIEALKVAAKKFIDTVMVDTDGNHVSVTIVPYNAQVNIGKTLREQFANVPAPYTVGSECVELPATAAFFSDLNIVRPDLTEIFTWADMKSGTDTSNNFTSYTSSSSAIHYTASITSDPTEECNITSPAGVNVVRLPNYNRGQLKLQIDGLVARGRTSITLGMKWGSYLIDPGARPMFTEFARTGVIDAAYNVRPYNYEDRQSRKFVILMTDGEHVDHMIIKPPYKTGLSPIWRSIADGNYSIEHKSPTVLPTAAGGKRWWVPHLVPSSSSAMADGWKSTIWNSTGSAANLKQLTWPEVWATWRGSYVAWQFYARALGTSGTTRTNLYKAYYSNADSAFKKVWGSKTAMDTSLDQTCDLLKKPRFAEEIGAPDAAPRAIVFGIALQAPLSGETVISNCATTSSYFYKPQNASDLDGAFNSIASQINYLRLTQ